MLPRSLAAVSSLTITAGAGTVGNGAAGDGPARDGMAGDGAALAGMARDRTAELGTGAVRDELSLRAAGDRRFRRAASTRYCAAQAAGLASSQGPADFPDKIPTLKRRPAANRS